MAKNFAAVLYGPNDLRVEERPVPEINEHEVLVEMKSVGICGSDVKIYSTGRCGLEALTEPMIIGHEGAGIVAKVGSKVSNLKVGDRVAIEPTQPCRACALCKAGRYNVCVRPAYCSTDASPGNLTHYYKHIADFCHKIPDNLTLDEGAAVQPLAIAIHACYRASIKLGDSLLILGAGPIGVLCAMTARAMGATKILITDTVQSRLDTARELGVDIALKVSPAEPAADIVQRIETALGARPDITIDACAYPSAQAVALTVTRTGGVVVVVGIGPPLVELPLAGALLREVDVRGSYRLANTYPAALAAVSSGAVSLRRMITHHFALADAQEALELARSGAAMKIIIHL